MKLYVDCDDTLIRWLDPLEGRLTSEWEPNTAVQEFVRNWKLEHPDGEVIVWSSGGEDYARMWGYRLLPDVPHVALSKFNAIVTADDLCIDDMPFEVWKHRSIHPKSLEETDAITE